MFHSAAIKLTGWYLLIVMMLSLGCSFAIYRISSTELQRSVDSQVNFFNNLLSPLDASNFANLRQHQLNEERNHLKANLLAFNVFVLIAGGAASYGLARRTLSPIEEALDAQSRFAGDASHELRTPLTAMQAEIEVTLRDKNLTKDKTVKQLESNLEEVAKLQALSEGLLELSRQKGLASDQQTSLKKALKESISKLTKPAATKKITIEDKTESLKLRVDAASLSRLMSILLDNAIKYSPAGSVIRVTTSKQPKTGLIHVQDQGQGIKSSDLKNIFERFYRSDAARSRNSTGGYGLGLAIAKKIVDDYEGAIEVKSSVGKGSTFSLKLPLA